MDKLFVGIKAANLVKLLLDEIFHRLDIVVCHLLDVLNTLCAFLVEVGIDAAELWEESMVKGGELRERQLTKCDEILNLYAHSVTDECILGKIVGQRLGLSSITAIYRRYGCQQIKCHKFIYK